MTAKFSLDDERTLETLIDSYSLHGVLAALCRICGEKAEHVQTNWQDKALAKEWERAANKIDKAGFGSGLHPDL